MLDSGAGGDQPKSSHRRKRQKKLFADSGLTVEQRRETRVKLRSIHDELEAPISQERVDELAEKNNWLFTLNVKYAREAVLDGANLHLIAQKNQENLESGLKVSQCRCHDFRCPRRRTTHIVAHLVSLCDFQGPSL